MRQSTSTDRTAISTVLAAVAAGLRLVQIPNIYAVGALGLYAGGRLPFWIAWVPSMAVMAGTDLVLQKLYAWTPFNPWVYGSFLVYVLLGRLLAGTRSPWRVGGVTVLGSFQFFLITNFGFWYDPIGLVTPMYPPTLNGLIACYVAGLPFLGYTLLGDLGCTAAAFAAEAWLTRPAAGPVAEKVRGMKFAAVIEYLQDAAEVERLRPVHRAYLAALKDKGQLAASGPFADGSGALIVYEAATAEAAETLLKADPFHANGIFLRWQLRPWNAVIANRELFPA